MSTINYPRYISVCREAGLTADSSFGDIEDVIFEAMEDDGFGCGFGYTADDKERDEAWDTAHDIARRIHKRL
jgi:hypothetical protein